MALVVKKLNELVTPGNFKLKLLIYGPPGLGKTKFLSTAPGLGVAACETGHGSGVLTIADSVGEYAEPTCLADLETIANGGVFKDRETLGLDSLSAMTRTFIKDAALAIPRAKGNSPKRQAGVPELDDYGVMGEMTRRILNRLLDMDKHIIVTATERIRMPDPETGVGEILIGPDLPGDLFTSSTAMFDFVFRLRVRQVLKDPRDAKSKFTQRYFLTQPDGQGTIAKCRSNSNGVPFLAKEEIFDLESGNGTFPYFLNKILAGYGAAKKEAA